jgi:hypothetical protein
VSEDCIVLHYLPQAPHFKEFYKKVGEDLFSPSEGPGKYLYRVNCGGPDYKDSYGNMWLADREKKSKDTWGSVSWTKQFPGMPAFFASQRQTYDPIAGASDWPLLQTFRYGLQQLKYEFPVPDGDYRVELYFKEPWWGRGGLNAKGWRVFDVAINNKTVISNLDIWSQAGNRALKQVVDAHVTGGQLTISFPHIAAGQAVISAIAIATKDQKVVAAAPSPTLISKLEVKDSELAKKVKALTWLNNGDQQYSDSNVAFTYIPPTAYGAEWIQMPFMGSLKESGNWASFTLTGDADVFIAIDSKLQLPDWLKDYEDTKTTLQNTQSTIFKLYRKRFLSNSIVTLGSNGTTSSPTGGARGDLYSVILSPVTTLQPPFDQKPTTSYKMDQAVTTGEGIARQTINKRESVVFTKPAGAQVDVTINTGVGDVYSITFRYSNPSTETRKATWQLIAADGTVMKTEPMEFTTTREGKWNYFSTTSGSMINAGKYTVRIIATDAEGVAIGGVDVQ